MLAAFHAHHFNVFYYVDWQFPKKSISIQRNITLKNYNKYFILGI